jgi:predicted DNA-binding protein
MTDTDIRATGDRRLPVVGVRQEVIDALAHLSEVTGLSRTYLIRSVLEQHLSELGLLAPVEILPTKRKGRRA